MFSDVAYDEKANVICDPSANSPEHDAANRPQLDP